MMLEDKKGGRKKTRKRKAEDQYIRHVVFVASTAAPHAQILERVRAKRVRWQPEKGGEASDHCRMTEAEALTGHGPRPQPSKTCQSQPQASR